MVDTDEEEYLDRDDSPRERPEPDDWPYEPSDRECEAAARGYVGWLRTRDDRAIAVGRS